MRCALLILWCSNAPVRDDAKLHYRTRHGCLRTAILYRYACNHEKIYKFKPKRRIGHKYISVILPHVRNMTRSLRVASRRRRTKKQQTRLSQSRSAARPRDLALIRTHNRRNLSNECYQKRPRAKTQYQYIISLLNTVIVFVSEKNYFHFCYESIQFKYFHHYFYFKFN